MGGDFGVAILVELEFNELSSRVLGGVVYGDDEDLNCVGDDEDSNCVGDDEDVWLKSSEA